MRSYFRKKQIRNRHVVLSIIISVIVSVFTAVLLNGLYNTGYTNGKARGIQNAYLDINMEYSSKIDELNEELTSIVKAYEGKIATINKNH
ncbi:MAG: hypothetical protein FWF26_05670, partial [Treponema sp.]|nr:hypothetical protein [Treponema sp.]